MRPERRPYRKPTRDELEKARTRSVPDVIARGLGILFCGINPGLYSGAVGHHFARPGNRFWKALHRARITPRRLEPWEEADLLQYGCGVTNLVARVTAAASELSPQELVRGRRSLAGKAGWYKPRVVAILGIGAYRTGFGRSRASMGRQPRGIGASEVWVLPNPSGLNANYTLSELAGLLAGVKRAGGI
jgi:TDG/mug DNA glycosylase family protein